MAFALICGVLQGSAAVTHYVNLSNATPAVPFLDWASAATNIQDAVDAAGAGDEIVVSDGVYQSGGRVVYGALTNRVAVTKPVTLRSLNGPGVTRITGNYVLDDTAVRGVYLADGAVLSGFTVSSGGTRATGDAVQEQSGGGIWCETIATTVTNCIVAGHYANFRGGGAYSGTFRQCTLSGSFARAQGGGAYASILEKCSLIQNVCGDEGGGAYASTLNQCTLLRNRSQTGAGACASTLSECYLTLNSATSEGGGAYGSTLDHCGLTNNSAQFLVSQPGSKYYYHYVGTGGGVSSCTLNSCTLAGNRASSGGGANASTLTNCTLTENSIAEVRPGPSSPMPWMGAAQGAGASASTLDHCTLSGNWIAAGGTGGGAFGCLLNDCILASSAGGDSASTGTGGGAANSTLFNCLVTGNSANDSYATSKGGGAIGSVLVNCTVFGNTASVAGGGVLGSFVTNCIVYSNTATANPNYDTSTLDHSCALPLPAGGLGNFTNNPLFVNMAAGDFHLQTNSPCLNAGTNVAAPGATDLDGRPRIVGGTVDVGAYEFQGVTLSQYEAWLAQHGLPTDASSDTADPDGDGASNWQEWIAGTDPTNALSVLRLLPPARSPSGVSVSWLGASNRSYFLEFSPTVGSTPAFQLLATNLAGQGGVTVFVDTNAPPAAPRYYRVGVPAP